MHAPYIHIRLHIFTVRAHMQAKRHQIGTANAKKARVSSAVVTVPPKGKRPAMPKVMGASAAYRGCTVTLKNTDTWRVFIPAPLCRLVGCGRVDDMKKMVPSKEKAFNACLDKIDEKLG